MFREETEHEGKETSTTLTLSQKGLSEGAGSRVVSWKMDR